MWQKLSLRARLNMLLALVLTVGLAINIARLVLEAAPRVQAEDQSVIRLARGFVEQGRDRLAGGFAVHDHIVERAPRFGSRRRGGDLTGRRPRRALTVLEWTS